jgi:hypothetical protein
MWRPTPPCRAATANRSSSSTDDCPRSSANHCALPELRYAFAPPHQAASYRGILAGLEPDDRWWFAAEPRRRLERAVELVSC